MGVTEGRLGQILATRRNYILDELAIGRQAADIVEKMPKHIIRRRGRHDNSEQIGKLSEQRVYRLLLAHPLVSGLEIDDKPLKGIEGLARLNTDYCLRAYVPLQVKSSELAIRDYYDSSVYEWARERYGEIIVLDGGPGVIKDDDIIKSFVQQLVDIKALPPDYIHSS